MVMIPIAADQPDNARHCAELGVARVVSPEEQTVEAIRVAARDVLANQRYRERAMRMRDEMRAMPDVRQVIPLLERMADCALDGW
jgi:UDP:flavonoid glycosyltransferase YjiC (YdhE family)